MQSLCKQEMSADVYVTVTHAKAMNACGEETQGMQSENTEKVK